VPSESESTPTNRGAKTRRLLAILIAIVAVVGFAAILALHLVRQSGKDPAPSSAPIGGPTARASATAAPLPAGPIELLILAPIVVGSTSKGWKVEAIHAVRGGTITVSFAEEKGSGVINLLVALSSDDGVMPPATAGRYAVFYEARGAVPEEGERLAGVLARTLEKNQSAPVPPGLGRFEPQPQQRHPL